MDTGVSYHISHGNIKFIVKKYVQLTENKHEFVFSNDHYSMTFTLEKKPTTSWSNLTNRVYGKKVLRFTHRTNGEYGLWLVIRFPQETIIGKALEAGSIWRTVSIGDLTYSFTISFHPEIVEQIKERCDARTKQIIDQKRQQLADEKKPIEYICHNPRPYQGGSFSSK